MKYINEPYRIFFPLGTLLFLCGILLWIPQLFNSGEYPVLLHRALMLNGFTASFIGGFLMTAVPKFSQTDEARPIEVGAFFVVVMFALIAGHLGHEICLKVASALQPITILIFLLRRITKRKQNPPYSFVFIFVGLTLWALSSLLGIFIESDALMRLHYEGAIAAIILGVGSRLIPGILGHVEIVAAQRSQYERPISIIKTVPIHFVFLIAAFVGSYFAPEEIGNWVRLLVVGTISFTYWKLYLTPKDKTALTWCIWFSAWMITLSFFLRALWTDAGIHASHSFFINGIALLSFLIATRVLQSHGPKNKELENEKVLYAVTGLVFISSVTRVSAYILAESYQHHLGYSALILSGAAILWGWKYLRYAK